MTRCPNGNRSIDWIRTKAPFTSREVLPRSIGACADRNGVDGELPVVCRDGEVGGARGCGRVTGEDPGQRFTTAKTRSAGRGADFEAAAGKTVSAHTDSFERRKGSGAAVDSPSQAGANSGAGEERAAALAMNQGITRKSRLWSQTGERSLRELLLRPWARRRRDDPFR